MRIAPFSNRLAHAVPSRLQALRCLANYEALRFSEPIRTLGEKMVERMISNSSTNGGKYISIHLRFEEVIFHFLNIILLIIFLFCCFSYAKSDTAGHGGIFLLYL